jgi:hypothetical protein
VYSGVGMFRVATLREVYMSGILYVGERAVLFLGERGCKILLILGLVIIVIVTYLQISSVYHDDTLD